MCVCVLCVCVCVVCEEGILNVYIIDIITFENLRIYIYCHPQTDCFVVSQLFSESRHIGRLKPGSKPAQLYVRISIRTLSQTSLPRQLGNYKVLNSSVRLFTFYTVPDTRVLNSFEEPLH